MRQRLLFPDIRCALCIQHGIRYRCLHCGAPNRVDGDKLASLFSRSIVEPSGSCEVETVLPNQNQTKE